MTVQSAPAERRLILCVEDERQLRTNVVEELVEAGYEVVEADDGVAALAVLETCVPDLVLCDITMPRMGGYELLREVRARGPELADVPFVFLTALSDRIAVIEGRSAGADDYLTKPVDFDLMLITVKSRLDQVDRVKASANAQAEQRRAQEVARALQRGLNDLTTAFDRVSMGVLLFDAGRNVIYANPQSKGVLGKGLAISNSKLQVQSPAEASLLRAALAKAIDEGENSEFLTISQDAEHPLIVQFISLGRGGTPSGASAAAFLIDTNAPAPLSERLVARLYGFTPTEARVATALARGHQANQILADMGITTTTFAFHLRNIFRKAQVSRQQELVALLARSAVVVQVEGGD
ncbi:response regulator transcription factor [Youhaiella tibetensis]|uniref:Response regulator transcription factor n=1 Tax=Paradevosia tibetensis TaxID=1447062 RepID=A0A5B9DLH8_9HYPH|nr:response regulator [Youhaiella tibetensis]QEE19725.1 response regulator transcription factor [Youhaiella tibetensis]